MIGIIDYKTCNVRSIQNMLKKIGQPSFVSSNPNELKNAEKLVLPGVGSFDKAITNLCNLDLIDFLNTQVLTLKVPILGICLGMQLMTKSSEEGQRPGFAWIDARTLKFQRENSDSLKIPHMRWNELTYPPNQELFQGYTSTPRYYFVHSYYVHCNSSEVAIGKTRHGIEFTSAFRKDNIFGVQFHPEKSHRFGMQLLRNFCNLPSCAKSKQAPE